MRLKKLILHGFKSFADHTEFVFDSPITGIVGPNGCGKSNVVDGFKWVLGEQSAKSLRGEAMMDVIFNGSGGRKPAGFAEVTLVFENPKREDGVRTLNLDVDEVAVGRRLFRDGSSEYQINNRGSRLKDIRELFLDTGVGVDAYSVIEQGRVSALLEANPDERRLIFEEAAGISKFKQRKKEAQRKLEKVDQNLLRVTDIVEEVEKRLRGVKIQAGRARTFQEHSQRLGELRLTYALQEYHTHHGQLAELDKQREDAQFRLDDLAKDLATNQNELAGTREKFDALSQQRQRTEYELVQAKAAMQAALQRQNYAEQQLQQIADQLDQFENDRESLAEKAAATDESLGQETQTLARLTAELEEHRKLIEQRQGAYRDGQLQLNQINKEIEQTKSAILDLMRRLAQTNNAISSIDIERKNIASQQTRLADRRRIVVAEIEGLESQRADLQSKLDAAISLHKERQADLETRRAEASQLGKHLAGLSNSLGGAKEHRSGLVSRQKVLQDLEAKLQGVSEGVKSVLRQRGEKFRFVRGLVADVLRVDVEHAHIIEAALDGRDQWLVTDDSALAVAASKAMADLEGRVNFVCVDQLPENAPSISQRDTGVSPVLEVPANERATDASPTEHGRDARVKLAGALDSAADARNAQRDTGVSRVREASANERSSDAHATEHGLDARVTLAGAVGLAMDAHGAQGDTGVPPVLEAPANEQAPDASSAEHGRDARVMLAGAVDSAPDAHSTQGDTGVSPVLEAPANEQAPDASSAEHGRDARVTLEGALDSAADAHGAPRDTTSGPLSPVLRGEGGGEGSNDEMRDPRSLSSDPSPQPSPLSTGERGPENPATVEHYTSGVPPVLEASANERSPDASTTAHGRDARVTLEGSVDLAMDAHSAQRDTGVSPVLEASANERSPDASATEHGRDARVTLEGALDSAADAHGAPRDTTSGPLSPVLRGEGGGEGPHDEMRDPRNLSSDPSPQPSPLCTGERGPEHAAIIEHSTPGVVQVIEASANEWAPTASTTEHGRDARVTLAGAVDSAPDAHSAQRDTGVSPVCEASAHEQPTAASPTGHGRAARVTLAGAVGSAPDAHSARGDTGDPPVLEASANERSPAASPTAHGRDARVTLDGASASTMNAHGAQRGTGILPVLSAAEQNQPAKHGRDPLPTLDDAYDWNQHAHPIRLAVDLVRFERSDAAIAMHLLGRTVFVDDLPAAFDLHANGPRGYRYVTPAGEVLEADGILRAGPLTAAMGLLSRHAELEALKLQIAEVDQRIAELTAQLTSGNAQAKTLEEDQNVLRNAIYDANTTRVQLTSSLAQNQDRQNSLRREQPVLDRELQGFLDQIGKLSAREQKLTDERQQFEADQAARQQAVEEKAVQQQQTADNLRVWSEDLTSARVTLGQVQEKQLAAQQGVQRLTAAKGELAQQLERVMRSAESLTGRRSTVQKEAQQAKEAEASLQEKQEALAKQLQTLEAQVKEMGQVVSRLAASVESLREQHADLEQTLHAVQLHAGEVRVRLETQVSRTMEELQLDLPAKYASLSDDGGPGYQPTDTDWEAVAAEIKELRDKIHRLGNVNLDSLSELDELEQRQTFLSAQVTDLTSSKQQLEQLIDEINTESGIRFEQTFNAVREHFQGMFRKLFGGGKADIFLQTEPDDDASQLPITLADGQTMLPVKRKIDVLDAGIEIMAHPPGKKPVSISQLSGGEKTMTCVALLLSIFKSKPSPFCILDEVDAALDEANNQRFNLIVQEFLEQSQFIVITHSKRTMQIADVLYGVTMQEQGVSKRVAVKFDQVDGQGRIKENEYAAA